MRVLIVDDDPTALRLLEALVTKRGHQVVACADGEAAWDAYRDQPVPLAFLDIGLPGMSGLELCRMMRAHEAGGQTVVVAITAGTDVPDLMQTLEAGVDDYLLKSMFQPGFLSSRVAIAESWVRDREARRRAEAELRASRESFHNVVERLEDGIVVTDSDGQVAYANRAAEILLDREADSMYGRDLELSLRAGDATELSLRPRGSDGDRVVEMTTVQTEWAGEQALMASLRDVSRLMDLQEALRRSEMISAMGTLVGGVAHEVRNPLFAISATIDAVYAVFSNDEHFSHYEPFLGNLKNEANRMSTLMGELLDFARPPTHERSECRFASVVGEAVTRCTGAAIDAGVKLKRCIETEDDRVEIEKERIIRVLENLLFNAIAFSPVETVVEIVVEGFSRNQRKWISCTVADQGPGFGEEDLPHIFEPFFSRRKGGTGLGLALSQKIATEHGGKITAANGSSGARMTLILPSTGKAEDCIRGKS